MNRELSEGKMVPVLDWAYDKAVNGVAGLDSAGELAEGYMSREGSRVDQANSLIRWQNTKAGTSGFVTGFGGLLTMPVTVPASISSVLYIQVRMIAAIAHIGGHDLTDDRVRTLVYVCLTGNAAREVLKDVGVVIGTKLTTNAIKRISGRTLVAINRKVGFRLFTKFGEKGAINLGKAVPFVGAVIGATVDSVSTNTIGNVARDTFVTLK